MKCVFFNDLDCPAETDKDLVCEECLHYEAYCEIDDIEPDAHSCSANADALGYCQVCGAIVHGSVADYEVHGYDPPGTY